MPVDNRFRHQEYHWHPPPENWSIVTPGVPLDPDSTAFADQLASAGNALREHEIGSIYLVHGTLAGTDLTGLHREIQRVAPRLAKRMGATWKQLIDMFVGDMGNYTQQYANVFHRHINTAGAPEISVDRFLWTSENHHLGRAEAAMRLLVELSQRHPTTRRIMLWGHRRLAGTRFTLECRGCHFIWRTW